MPAFIEAAHYRKGRRGHGVRLGVLHSAEIPEKGDTAEATARYFASGKVVASSHSCVDADSRVDCVRDEDAAFTAPPVNDWAVQLEQAGYARQSRADWLDPYSERMLREQVVPWILEKHRRHGIPLRFLRAAELRAYSGARGFTTHHEVNLAFKKSTHTDPGPGYPIDFVMGLAAGTLVPSPVPIPEAKMHPTTFSPTWAAFAPSGRAPFYSLLPGDRPSEAIVLAYNGATLERQDGDAYGIPLMRLSGLAGRALGLGQVGERVVAHCEDGGVIVVGRK